jgi:subtilase family serine protease
MKGLRLTTATLAAALAVPAIATAHTTYYAIGKPVCRAPKGMSQPVCLAEKRVLVKQGTKGAHAISLAAGASGAGTTGPAGGLTPTDLATAYGLTTTGGAGQTLALIDAYNDPNINADLQTFDGEYGLAACSEASGCLKVVNQTGGTTLPANDPNTGWAVEESLDVEAAHAVCQGCKLIVVEASNQNLAPLAAAQAEAVRLGANETSNSWGYPESDSTATVQKDFNHSGTVIAAAAGDDGYYDFDLLGTGTPSPYNQTNIPAAYNTVVAVGGTSLFLGQNGARQSETVWNDNGTEDYNEQLTGLALGAGGGGCSTLFPAQGWQTSLSVWASTACGTARLDADISAVADPLTGFDIYDSYTGDSDWTPGWGTIGGTSLASPIIAATYALAGGAHGVPYPALTLYGHPGKADDVTTGGNGWCGGGGAAQCGCNYGSVLCTSTNPNLNGWGIVDCAWDASGTPTAGDRACDAQAGYDGPSGWGTPNGLTAFLKTGPSGTITGPSSIAAGTSGTWQISATDPFPGGSVTSYTWNWGDGTPNTVTTTGSASHTYATSGTKTITLTLEDNYGVKTVKTYGVTVS